MGIAGTATLIIAAALSPFWLAATVEHGFAGFFMFTFTWVFCSALIWVSEVF